MYVTYNRELYLNRSFITLKWKLWEGRASEFKKSKFFISFKNKSMNNLPLTSLLGFTNIFFSESFKAHLLIGQCPSLQLSYLSISKLFQNSGITVDVCPIMIRIIVRGSTPILCLLSNQQFLRRRIRWKLAASFLRLLLSP